MQILAGHTWSIITFVWIVVVAAVVWSYGRKRARRDSERDRRFQDMLSQAKVAAAVAAPGAQTAGTAAATSIVQQPAAPAAAPAQMLAKKQRLLPQADALLYFLLRAGLPDHEVFAGLTLADLVEFPGGQGGYDAVQKQRRLAQQRVDFVVCNRRLETVAAVVIDRAAPADAAQKENRRLIEESLRAAGIRLVCIDAAAPPRHQQMRALVCGEVA
jgi:hypothetical protein